ncbi:TonB-dependent receptor [Paracidobacterium acidisoli]|uniref:TonB-dependent receptor n=1 Tax=Paracidobacterium acidisoli TaxID=2303751 RepID=UPI001314A67B|nr:TonB-dependent receptor [Paracidobacterium acidisoli]
MKTLLRRSLAALILGTTVLASGALSNTSFAQESAGASITGTVTDLYGNAIQKASVAVKNESTEQVQQFTTDNQGHFVAAGLAAGSYDVTISSTGFATTTKTNVAVAAGQLQSLSVQLKVGLLSQNVEVEAQAVNSIAAQHALSQGSLDTEAPKSEISSRFIQEFTPPTSDYSEIIQIAPGTFSYNSNGIGLGQGTTYFRGFPDGDYDITWDGIPFDDTNTPTHHSWAFFPGLWTGGVDFDRSPGTASTIGPSTFGGSINLLSKDVPGEQSVQPSVSYGSFNTLLIDGQYNSGFFGPSKRIGLTLDVHRMTSDGFETLNDQTRNAGDIKVLYKLSDRTTITGYSGVIRLSTNTPNNPPLRAQVAAYGWNYLLQNNDSTSAFYQKYNTYNLPTDFEYVGVNSDLGHGWLLDVKPYTYSYYNAQYYANDNPNDSTGLANGPNSSTNWIFEGPAGSNTGCNNQVKKKTYMALPCAVDKLNSYRKYGETSTISQVSKYGVFRTGMWYEWATTNRYQFPSDPITHIDQALPNFHEHFYTNSYNPYAEYEWHATKKLTITAGDKYAYYNMNLTQYADDGKIVGSLQGRASVNSSGGFGSNLPSAEANYKLTNNWSAYGQFGKGSEIPPSSTFDVAGGGQEVGTLPKPTETTTYQGGTVVKLNRMTLDADYFRVKFQNNYVSNAVANPNNPAYDLNEYYLGPDSITEGFEAEANAFLGYGFNVYANGTAGKATYTGTDVPSGLYVADAPTYTQSLAVTYEDHGLDLGVIEKRVGDHYNDNGSYHNQVYDAPFNNVNLFLNYTLHNHSIFNQSKISFSVNNLFNDESILDVASSNGPAKVNGSAYIATTAASPLDQLSLTAGRSFMFSLRVGIFPNHN